MLCDDPRGDLGREARKGGDIVYLRLIHVAVGHKPIQHCKAIILQIIF